MKTKKIAALLIAATMLTASLAGCSGASAQTGTTEAQAAATTAADGSGSSSAGTPTGPITLRIGISADPGTLSPFVQSGSGFSYIANTLYEPLGDLSAVGGVLEGYMMKSYKDMGNLTYDIDIYENIYDTAGNHITADDVIYSIKTMTELGGNNSMKYIDSVTKLGDYSIEMKLNCDFVGGFNRVIAACRIVSQKAFEASADQMATTPVGTTGYKLTSYVPGSSMVFTKTNNFWQTDKDALATFQCQNPDVIEYDIIKESSQMAIALETGKIDLALGMGATEAENFMAGGSSAKGFTVFTIESNITQQLYLNCDTDTVFYNNLPLRQAVLKCIDKQGLVDGAVNGYGNVLHDFGSDQFPDYVKAWDTEDYNDYDVDAAKAALKEAGYSEGELTLRIMTDNTPVRNKEAQIIQGYLLNIGINSTILQYDQALFNTYKNDTADANEWDIMLDNTGSSDYLVAAMRSKFDSRQYTNGTVNGVKDDKLQALVEKAIALDGHTEEDMNNLHEYLTQQAYCMGLFSSTTFMVAREGIESLAFDSKCYCAPCNTNFNDKY